MINTVRTHDAFKAVGRALHAPARGFAALLFGGFSLAALVSSGPLNRLAADAATRVGRDSVSLPLIFIENRGQVDPSVAYYVDQPGRRAYFTREGQVLRLSGGKAGERWSHVVRIELVGAATARIESAERTQGLVSYFSGPRDRWRGVATHGAIRYVEPWPGIDLTYERDSSALKSTYVVAPGADPGLIRLRYSGHDALARDDRGNLICRAGPGVIREAAPVAWQDIGGRRVPVDTRFRLVDGHTVGFEVDGYDPAHTLTIDPVIEYAGYIGGADYDGGNGRMAVDADGNVYVVGSTFSAETTFPVTTGPGQAYNGDRDIFVAKLGTDGALVYAGYIGGAYEDIPFGIAVNADGSVYIAGRTDSSETDGFPVVVGPDLTYNGLFSGDAFVAKVTADGSALAYAGYIGGEFLDHASGIAVDEDGNAYVSGYTYSTEADGFPVAVGPDLTHNGSADAFVVKVNAAGTALVYAGYVGGASSDAAFDIDVDAGGNAYVVGSTDSSETTLPVLGGPDLTYNGGRDGFVAKVNAAGSALVYLGYIGGVADDAVHGVAVDVVDQAYLTGETQSDETTFPLAVGPVLAHAGGTDAFVAKVSADGAALVQSGYIGGAGDDCVCGCRIVIDGDGNAYVSGTTRSDESTFPVLRGPDLTLAGMEDPFIAKVEATGSALVYAGYVGGDSEGLECSNGVGVDGAGNAYVFGGTYSSEAMGFPLALGPDLTYNGGGDAFVVKVVADLAPDSFAFADQGATSLDAEITSAPVTINGIDAATAIDVVGGSYSIDGGAFTSAAGTIAEGQEVRVRHTSAAMYETPTATTLTVGGVSDTFTSTTRSAPPRRGGGAPGLGLLAVLLGFGVLRIRNTG